MSRIFIRLFATIKKRPRLIVITLVGIFAFSLVLISGVPSQADTPVSIAPAHTQYLQINLISGSLFDSNNPSQITQMAFDSEQRLYAITLDKGVFSFFYDINTGTLSDMKQAVNINGLGIGFHGNTMYLISDDKLVRLTDDNGNGVWGEDGETRVNIVEGIPLGDHAVDHIQISGNTLYVGIGTRTVDGMYTQTQPPNPDSLGESSYGGSIAWIQDLTQVPSLPNAAQLRDENNNLLANKDFITNAAPYTSTAQNQLIVHSAGARNPFGIAFDGSGNLWMTNNYNRANSTADGQIIPNPNDLLDDDLSDDVQDQFFRVSYQADYGYPNSNWRNNPTATAAGFFDASKRVYSTTFDNTNPQDPRFHNVHDPANPDGLGPSSSADGFDFYKGFALPQQYQGKAFVSRWTKGPIQGGQYSLSYADIVLVDPDTGLVSQIATGFNNPLDVLADAQGLTVADWSGGIYRITAK